MKFGEFEERKWSRRRDEVIEKERSIERKISIDEHRCVLEGIVYEFKAKYSYMSEKGFVGSQQHLIGYHYLILQRNGEDVEGFQGNIKNGVYHYFKYDKTPIVSIKSDMSYKEALALFNKRNRMQIKEDLETVKKEAKNKSVIK